MNGSLGELLPDASKEARGLLKISREMKSYGNESRQVCQIAQEVLWMSIEKPTTIFPIKVSRRPPILLQGKNIKFENEFKYLGLVIDYKLSWSPHSDYVRNKQQEGYFRTDLVTEPGQMTRTTPELAPPLQRSTPTKKGERLATAYDLTCNRPHTRRIFSGIWFRTWNPPAPKAETLPLGHCGLRKEEGWKSIK
ncbi:hypothetical protein AVEN_254016-1 [Araneus ventricosus]|uniref:Uncharacterized protein n=1 Tax=Araneus ventricosus TaxID=182803 RepID=A0A4Y2E5T0_ARAVE|nr:hypothetical protein AVEN_254016-1 [Araneus ventricosus]